MPPQFKRSVPPDPSIPHEKYALANGVEVILIRDTSTPLVAVDLWYHVGSGAEELGRSGFAHLFEHMMFQGSANVGKDKHFETLKKIGVDSVNGTTNSDRTNYYEIVPANQLETALWLESDRLGHMLELLDQAALSNQIDVVKNERRQNYDNVAYRKALFAQHEALYPLGHPYRYLTIGKHEDLTAASVPDVKAFFKTWYVPSNATIAIAGNIDLAETKKLVERWFGTFPPSKKPSVIPVAAPTIKRTEVTVSDAFAKLPQLSFSWHSPARFAEGDAELDILGNVLDAEGPGRLFKTLVYDKQLAQSVNAGQGGRQFSGVFEVNVTLRTGADPEEVKRIVFDTIAQLTRSVATDREIARTVARREAQTIRSLESTLTRAEVLHAYNHYLGSTEKISWDLDRYRTTTPDKIRATAAKYLTPDRVVIITTQPSVAPGGSK